MTDKYFDVVIIGSGAGGAPIANRLVKAGRTVLILEKGPLFKTQYQSPSGLSDFKRDELFATGSEKKIQVEGMANKGQSYYSSHVEPDLNDEPHVYQDADGQDRATLEGYTAQVVGGGTQLYGGVSLRFTKTDFRLFSFNKDRSDIPDDVRNTARDWPISYAELEPYYCQAEELVGINGSRDGQEKPLISRAKDNDPYQTPLDPNPISSYVEAGMDALGMQRYRTPLAVITKDHKPSGRIVPSNPDSAKTSYVNRYGDPLGLKSNAWVSLLSPISSSPNFELWPNCVVTHLECLGNRVTRIYYRDPSGKACSVSGEYVVVACSAIESVRLLMLSKQENSDFVKLFSNDLLGKYFMTHCFGGAHGFVPGRYDKSRALDSDWATDFCATDDFVKKNGLWAGGAIYNNTSDHALPISMARTYGAQDIDTIWKGFVENHTLIGQGLVNFFDQQFGRDLSVAFMANQIPQKSNRIELHPSVKDKWKRPVAHIIKTWHDHDKKVMNTLAEQCATILRKGNVPIEGEGSVYMAENGRARIANHILGGARFGNNPDDSVLDSYCRVWNSDNLYVTDGAFMPTSGGANPTLTIQANSFRVADHLLALLNGNKQLKGDRLGYS